MSQNLTKRLLSLLLTRPDKPFKRINFAIPKVHLINQNHPSTKWLSGAVICALIAVPLHRHFKLELDSILSGILFNLFEYI